MDSRFTALMAESLKWAHPRMVTEKTFAEEMELIIAFHKKLEENQHPSNKEDKKDVRCISL